MASSIAPLSPLDAAIPLPFHDVSQILEAPVASSSKKRAAEATDDTRRPNKKSRTSKDAQATACSTSTTLSADQQARRDKLYSDPSAIVLDQHHIQCRKCGSQIKLSKKGSYDLHHWKRHRKRCDKWTEGEAQAKRAENAMDASRLSTPPLTEDNGTEATGTSVVSENSPPPEAKCSEGLLTSHKMCEAYMAYAHPELNLFSLEEPLAEIPGWSWERLRLPAFVDAEWLEAGRADLILSPADWDEEE